MILDFIDENVCRVRISKNLNPRPSIMITLGFVRESLCPASFNVVEKDDCYEVSSFKIFITILKDSGLITWKDMTGNIFLKNCSVEPDNDKGGSTLGFVMKDEEHFYGFGFQRKTFDARGHQLTFTKGYRWAEATVPFFMSTAGYGFFSANTYDHIFDFTSDDSYTIRTTGGETDFFIFGSPDFKEIIEKYTALTGKPHMVPKWSLGLCYIARVFEDEKGVMDIAGRFRKEEIPCDMIGLEPGWEETYYSMEWVWSKSLFPDPKRMISALKKRVYAFELWESGDAPTEGYLDEKNREKWFEKRVKTSLDYGVDFFKQDDPYPRCITSTEMVTDPTVEIFLKDDEGYKVAETRNIANTLYSDTVFKQFRKLTNKRTIVIFHSYNASVSSQRYPTGWAGDFQLGNGALNASLSGHAMVSQDMRNESPKGIHFGFLTPYSLIDSWATYREPWLFSEENVKITRIYARLRSSLFPYLYTMLWQSHTRGIPMMRPMVLEFQDDKNTYYLDKQFMLGDSLLVGTGEDKETSVYLPRGTWTDYWTRKKIRSTGQWEQCTWPDTVGGPLFVREGALIPMTAASDSIMLSSMNLLVIDAYPSEQSYLQLYEDDGISYEYENNSFAMTDVYSEASEEMITIKIEKPEGKYENMPLKKAYLIRVHLEDSPDYITCNGHELLEAESLLCLVSELTAGWFFEEDTYSLYIKPHDHWKLDNQIEDLQTFYHGEIVFTSEEIEFSGINLMIKKGSEQRRYGTLPHSLEISSQYKLLLADGKSSTKITAKLKDEKGRLVNDNHTVTFRLTGKAAFLNQKRIQEAALKEGMAEITLISSPQQEDVIIEAFCQQYSAETISIKIVQGTFRTVLNPPERVKLNYGDNWLPYYLFVNTIIEYEGEKVDSAFSLIQLAIEGNETRDIIRNHETISKSGVGRFEQIILGSPMEPPDVIIRLHAEGVKPFSTRYCVKENNRKESEAT
ncbi:MAG: DUF5110 domain-containing protein [Clostridia bacterium]|nr:DUF5110 domain-containing protein [Clostridia bacterium]